LWKSKDYNVRFIKEFPDKKWNRMGLDYVLTKLHHADVYCGTEGWWRPVTLDSRLLIWLLSSGVEDLELVCVRKEGILNIAFELTDGVDFVNHLSLLCNCVMIFKNI